MMGFTWRMREIEGYISLILPLTEYILTMPGVEVLLSVRLLHMPCVWMEALMAFFRQTQRMPAFISKIPEMTEYTSPMRPAMELKSMPARPVFTPHNQSQYGVYADQTGREAGWFRNASTSTYASLRTSHGLDTRYDFFMGGNGLAGADGRVSIYLDNNNNATNDYFEIVRSAAQGGDYVFWAGESGDAWIRDDFHCFGNLSKGSGTFKIDHPLDPENKYLIHSFVESPDMMNVYNGNVILDENGEATITMEDWFDVLNRDFRYQLTSIGAPRTQFICCSKNRWKHIPHSRWSAWS